MCTVDEVDVLDAVFPDERVELGHRQVARTAIEALEVGRDLRQHLLHMRHDPGVLAAQHGLEDGESLAEALLDAADLLGLVARYQPVHGERGNKGCAQADSHHHGKQKQTGLALHRRMRLSLFGVILSCLDGPVAPPVSRSTMAAPCRFPRRRFNRAALGVSAVSSRTVAEGRPRTRARSRQARSRGTARRARRSAR